MDLYYIAFIGELLACGERRCAAASAAKRGMVLYEKNLPRRLLALSVSLILPADTTLEGN